MRVVWIVFRLQFIRRPTKLQGAVYGNNGMIKLNITGNLESYINSFCYCAVFIITKK